MFVVTETWWVKIPNYTLYDIYCVSNALQFYIFAVSQDEIVYAKLVTRYNVLILCCS